MHIYKSMEIDNRIDSKGLELNIEYTLCYINKSINQLINQLWLNMTTFNFDHNRNESKVANVQRLEATEYFSSNLLYIQRVLLEILFVKCSAIIITFKFGKQLKGKNHILSKINK